MSELDNLVAEKRAIPAIVEGKRDVAALKHLGFTQIIELNRPLFEIVELFEPKSSVQILTDFDKKGKELYGKLFKGLSARGVRVDNALRYALVKTELSHVEGLDSFLSKS